MPEKFLPRVTDVSVGEQPYSVYIRWDRGGESLVNLSGLIETFRVYAPLRASVALFRQVRVGEYGTDIVWNDELDMPADTVWRLAQEQAGVARTAEAFCQWRDHIYLIWNGLQQAAVCAHGFRKARESRAV